MNYKYLFEEHLNNSHYAIISHCFRYNIRKTEIKPKLQIIIRTAAYLQYLNQKLPFRNLWNAVASAVIVPVVLCQHIFVLHPISMDYFCQRKISPVFTSVPIVYLHAHGNMIWNYIWNKNMEYIRQFECGSYWL